MKNLLFLFLFFSALFFTSAQAQQTKCIYMIGNSLTDAVNYNGFRNMALSQGNTHIWGRQSIPGSPLELLWDARGGGGFVESPFNAAENAFTKYNWDAVTLQPTSRPVEGSKGDKQMMLNYAGLLKGLSPDVQLYIYSRFPRVPENKYDPETKAKDVTADDWDALWNDTNPKTSTYDSSRKYFEDLYSAYNATDKNGLNKGALMIPVGDVMYAFNQKAKKGEVPGVASIWDFYDDRSHQKGTGSYLIMLTFYSTIYKEDVRGTNVPTNYGTIDQAIVDAIQETVYEVVFTHPYSGTTVADLVPVSGIELDKKNISLNIFNREQITATVSPENAAKKGIIWSSSNTEVAIVNTNGRVTSLSEGTATITAKTLDGGFVDECMVTVSGYATGETESGTLAAWNFDGKTSTENNNTAATSVMPGIGYMLASISDGLNVNKRDGTLSGSGQTTMDEVSSIADGEYISFKIKAGSGRLISIDNIQFASTSQNRARTFALYSSVKGFSVGNAIYSHYQGGLGSLHTTNITGHNNLDEVEFRIYIYGYDNMYEFAGLGNRAGDDFIVNGSIFSPVNEAPSAPENMKAIEVKDTYINFEWDESTDDFFVKGYNFYFDGEQKNTALIENTTFVLDGLESGQECNVEVEAIDFLGKPSNKSSFFIHANRPPLAIITPSATTGKVPLTLTFGSDTSTDPDEEEGDYILGFDWRINDETLPEKERSIEHTFTNRGIYEVELIVMDSRGMFSVASKTTITVTADQYSITVNNGTTEPAISNAYEGDIIVITANEPNEGMTFDRWVGNDVEFEDATSAETSFIMPGKNVEISAVFSNISIENVKNGNLLYPNPALDYITIGGMPESNYIVSNLLGTIFLSGKKYSGETVDITGLSPGVYFIQTGNKIFKFIKK